MKEEILKEEINSMKAVTTTHIRIGVDTKEKLEKYLNPTQSKFLSPKIAEYVEEAILEKMARESKTAGLKKSA